MKVQDLAFLAVLFALFLIRKPRLFVYSGLLALLLAIPLFYLQIFFTAERLTWYAAGYLLVYIMIVIARKERSD